MAPVVAAFCAGVVAGAFGYLFVSFWCLALPIAGLMAIIVLASGPTPAPKA
jgi:hypothetical protein